MGIVILLCGTPGSGKSTLKEELVSAFQSLSTCGNSLSPSCSYTVSTLAFDDIQISMEEWNETSFKESRQRGLECLQGMLAEKQSRQDQQDQHDQHDQPADKIVIVDDIMYLHSMRREIYTIARDNGYILLIVCVKAELDVCLSRNSLRPVNQRVASQAIENIFAKFEFPNSTLVCDRYNVIVHSDDSTNWKEEAANRVTSTALELLRKNKEEKANRQVAHVFTNENQSTAQSSMLHQLDLFLRKAISSVQASISKLQHSTTTTASTFAASRKNISQILTEAKKETLLEARERVLLLHQERLPLIENEGTETSEFQPQVSHFFDFFIQRVTKYLLQESEEIRQCVIHSLKSCS